MADILNSSVWTEADASNVAGTRPTWPEGMLIKDVNDSARAMQGALKRWANQINATVTTSGTGSAYIIAYGVAPAALYNGQRFAVLAHAPCGASPTLNINSLGAKIIKKMASSGVSDISANEITVNMVLDLIYIAALNQYLWINAPTPASGGIAAHTHPQSDIANLITDLAAKAALVSPNFTGTPNAPTAAALTSTTQLATTAFVTAAVAAATSGGGGIITKSASATLLITDAANLVAMDVSSANTLTVPLNSAVPFPVNTEVDIVQHGTGQTTLVATVGVTLRSSGSKLKLTSRYSGATIKKLGTNDWYAWGDLSA